MWACMLRTIQNRMGWNSWWSLEMTYANTHTDTTQHIKPIWIWSTLPHNFTEHWNAWMKMDRISWNVIRGRLLVIAGPHLGFRVCCHLPTQRLVVGLNAMGFTCPWFPYKGKLPGRPNISRTFMVMPLQVSKVKVSVTLAFCPSLLLLNWSICHRAQPNQSEIHRTRLLITYLQP